MKSIAKLLLVLTVLSFNSIYSLSTEYNTIQKQIAVTSFDNLKIDGPFRVIIKQGDKESLSIEGDNEMIQYVKTRLKNNNLKIYLDTGLKSSVELEEIKLHITVKNIKELHLNGFIDLNILNTLSTDTFNFISSGTTNATININAKSITCNISSFSNINMSGNSDNLVIKKSDGSSLNATQLASKNVDIESSGMGKLKIQVTEKLKVNSVGAVQISYKGNPTKTDINVKELSTINKV